MTAASSEGSERVAVSAPSSCASRRALRIARRCGSGRRCNVGVSTYTACQVLPNLAAKRAAVRTSFSLPVWWPMHSKIASWVCQTFSCPWVSRQARIWSSTRSAVRRSASSRRAMRLPLRKKFSIARSAWPARYTLPSFRRWRRSSGGRSTNTTSSAASKKGSGTVSRTWMPVTPLTTSFRLSRC